MVSEPMEDEDEDRSPWDDWAFLLVDDNPAALTILRTMLGMLGVATPREAMDGAHAMELVRENAFDCIITDLRMHPMSGAEFIRWVRRSNEAGDPNVKILAISAYHEVHEIGDLKGDGANGFLGKPLSVAALESALQAMLNAPEEFFQLLPKPDGAIYHGPDLDDDYQDSAGKDQAPADKE